MFGRYQHVIGLKSFLTKLIYFVSILSVLVFHQFLSEKVRLRVDSCRAYTCINPSLTMGQSKLVSEAECRISRNKILGQLQFAFSNGLVH